MGGASGRDSHVCIARIVRATLERDGEAGLWVVGSVQELETMGELARDVI